MTYSIKNDKLHSSEDNVEYHNTTKKSGTINPRYLVLHYTAGASFESDVRTLSTSNVQASCHLVLSKDGKWAQISKLTDKLWHAGRSHWDGLNGMNNYSIGIEVSCEGPVDYVRTESDGSKTYRTWFGEELNNVSTPIVDAAHRNGGPVRGWVLFSPKQLEEIIEVGQLLMNHYNLKEAVGHDMISPSRKIDPGPCMPDNVYALLNGRNTEINAPGDSYFDYEVIANSGLNMRAWPSTESKIITVLPNGTKVDKIRNKDEWFLVKDENNTEGWVHSNWLKRL